MKQGTTEFVDYFEVLKLSPGATPEAVESAFQSLARPFQNNQDSRNRKAFQRLFTAYRVLSDPPVRVIYEAEHRAYKPVVEASPNEADPVPPQTSEPSLDHEIGAKGIHDAKYVRLRMLAALYAKRLTDFDHSGMTILEIENLSACTRENLYVAAWYLREKGFIEPDNSRYLITVQGMDEYETMQQPAAVGDKRAEPADSAEKAVPADLAENDTTPSLRGLSGAVLSSKQLPMGQEHGQPV